MKAFTEKVIKIIQNIPSGQVMTYGQIAKLADSPRGARQVVRILHSMSEKYNLPWYRVVNIRGEISLANEAFEQQKWLLEDEGVEFISNRVISLKEYQFYPDIDEG